jgi:glycosyltransferase involved in cell wall biosynthesis
VLGKARVAQKVLSEQGLLGFTIVSLQHVQKKTRQHKDQSNNTPKGSIYTKAKYSDIRDADLIHPRKPWPGTKRDSLRFNWIMPPPGKGSGGHLNIFRFIKYLEEAGHECRIYMYAQGADGGPVGAVHAIMGDSYPAVNATKTMRWLTDTTQMEEADGIFSTSWETAYASFNSPLESRRFYFVQDFEPYFYPAGSFYTFAENTYKFNFFGITAGGWLSNKLSKDFGMRTAHYDFGCDKTVYFHKNSLERKEILFYVRPYTERRGFETGIMALDIFHQKHPDYIINLVGWDVSEYDIPFQYVNLKTLEINELNELYNRCAAGLVLSFTNMSLLPLELLGSGTIPVVNKGDNNVQVSNNPYIAYADNDPISLAKALSDIVTKKDLLEYAHKASESVDTTSWDDSGKVFVSVIERETRSHE